ncbi:hypothetical protein EMCRGX_G020590 [Ephydatia muelleri]
MERQKELFVVKGRRSKDAAVVGLIEQTVVESSSSRKREEMIEGTRGEDDNGEQWTEIEELDDVEGEENTLADGEELSQLSNNLASFWPLTVVSGLFHSEKSVKPPTQQSVPCGLSTTTCQARTARTNCAEIQQMYLLVLEQVISDDRALAGSFEVVHPELPRSSNLSLI